jgi:hypothetical protein
MAAVAAMDPAAAGINPVPQFNLKSNLTGGAFCPPSIFLQIDQKFF